ncbi:hypothetical protein N1851_030814 [Merluccius polli]|uniref:Uncharacterized protein n=1 Tax=Merluccius polli TaxID=89951 RepID=A0AA47M4Z0_MERPO|nr:hypothetical protein N1851_030814 [Merluccius polli]
MIYPDFTESQLSDVMACTRNAWRSEIGNVNWEIQLFLNAAYSETMTLDRNKEDGSLGSKGQTVNKGESLEDTGTTSMSALFIMESDDGRPHSVKPASWQGAAEVFPEVSETRI